MARVVWGDDRRPQHVGYDRPAQELHRRDGREVGATGCRLAHAAGFYSRASDDRDLDGFAKSLSDPQRALLARICSKERLSGIFDVLAALTWLVDCADLELFVNGKPMPVDLHGAGLHGDYIDRLRGGSWPAE
jgi:hypothetical protein